MPTDGDQQPIAHTRTSSETGESTEHETGCCSPLENQDEPALVQMHAWHVLPPSLVTLFERN